MSFSSTAKNELSRLPITKDHCALAELSALVRMCGTIQILGENKLNLKFNTENAAIARRIFSILKLLYDTDVEVMVRRNRQLKKNNNYLVGVSDINISMNILVDVGFIKSDGSNIFHPDYKMPESIIKRRCCKRAYIRGAFLGGGSISNPEKTYHLEFVIHSEEYAQDLCKLINSFGLNSKVIQRKNSYIIYIKEGEQIVDLLNIIGAHTSLLELENIRIMKEMRNNVNRLVNCETANLSKTVNAAVRQVESIKLIQEKIGLKRLPKNLQEVAELRLSYPDESLKELGEMLNPPVGKSGINHRLRKIEKIAEEIRSGNY